MTIEYFGTEAAPRLLVTVEAAELDGYGVTFGTMDPGNEPTRRLLRDLLSLVTRMGLRREGERMRVDCVSTPGGGCALLISRAERAEYVFESADDIISAYLAGALPEGSVSREEGRWIFRAGLAPDARQSHLLGEYCDRLQK